MPPLPSGVKLILFLQSLEELLKDDSSKYQLQCARADPAPVHTDDSPLCTERTPTLRDLRDSCNTKSYDIDSLDTMNLSGIS